MCGVVANRWDNLRQAASLAFLPSKSYSLSIFNHPLGFAQDERTPHTSTLDAIARYLGYAHWEELSQIEDKGNSDFDAPDDEIRSADLQPEAHVEIAYLPDRRVRLRYLGNQKYCIVESENSKLLVGDEVEIQNFVLHHPLLVLNVWRNGESLGQFTAGNVSGLSSIAVI